MYVVSTDETASNQVLLEVLRGALEDILSYGVPDPSTKVPSVESADFPHAATRGTVLSAGGEIANRTAVSR